MDNYSQPETNRPTYQVPGPDYYSNPLPGAGSQSGAAVTKGRAGKGRSLFLGGLAAVVLAAGAGVIGYNAADAMLGTGQDAVELTSADQQPDAGGAVDPADTDSADGTNTDGTNTDPANQDSGDGQTPVPGAAMTVEQANASVIRIEATGEFADPEFGPIEGVGSGSGFIINNDGVAVTNNHVVAGAAFLEIFVPGEDQPRNARILATSECSDLAVIDIEGSGFPAVALNMVGPTIGTDVYAAGYPLGDPEFTLTKGIVSKEQTRGDTHLSSVDGVLEHDAKINPGNSGGPLFDSLGQVVGINYQGNSSTDQSFAIASADAFPLIEQLVAGVSVDSIGINGQIVNLGDRYGLFVSSVETGSMADQVGLVPGDVILELENVSVSTDGTMGDYCDVLRTNGTDVPLNITVLRPGADQLLFGTLNGSGLNVAFDAADMMSDAGMAPEPAAAPASASDYNLVSDSTGTVSVEVPATWSDVSTSPLGSMGDLANVSASTDLDSFENQWVVGGVQLTAFDAADYDFGEIWQSRNQLLDNCGTVEEAQNVDLGAYSGQLRIGHDCGPDATASLLLFQVQEADAPRFASGIVQVVTPDDVVAAERALATFSIR